MQSEYTSDKFKALPRGRQITVLYDLLLTLIVDYGYKKTKDSLGGNIGEVITIIELDLEPRPDGTQGYDAKTRDGKMVELKVAESALDRQANFNFVLSQKILDAKLTTLEAQLWTLYEIERKKYDLVIMKHKKHSEYTFDGLYIIALLSKTFVANGKLNVNFGGRPCKKCHGIHRLEKFKRCEQEFLALLGDRTKLNARLWFELLITKHLKFWQKVAEPASAKENFCFI
jgi:hypothetical protein